MPKTPKEVLADPTFYQLPEGEQQKVLTKLDPSFGTLPMAERSKVLQMGKSRLGQTPVTPSPPTESAPGDWRDSLTRTEPHDYQSLLPGKGGQFDASAYGRELIKGVGNIGAGGLGVLLRPIYTAKSFGEQLAHLGEANFGQPQNLISDVKTMGSQAIHSPLETAETMTGQAGAMGGLSKVGGRALRGSKIALQDIAGAGREPVEAARNLHAKRVEALQDRYNQRLEDVKKANEQIQKDAAVKQADVTRENELAKQAVSAKTLAERKEYIRQLEEFRRKKSIAETTAKAPDAIEKRQAMVANTARENAIATFRKVKASLDARWGELQKSMGQVPVPKEPLAESIVEARNKFLMGAPDSLTIFNQLVKQLETDESGGTINLEHPQGGGKAGFFTPSVGSMPWEQARVFYSALGDKMYSGELPGNVWKALEHVRNSLDKELSNTARVAGKGEEYAGVKSDWSRFKRDWDDMSNMEYSKTALGESGSPLARLVRARTPEAALKVLKDDRLFQQMKRYHQFGADVTHPRQVLALESAKGKIPKVHVPKEPASVEKTIAKLAEPPEAPTLKPEPRAPKLPKELTPAEIRRRRLLEFAGRPYRPWDIVNPAHTLLKNDAIREAVAKQARKEITE